MENNFEIDDAPSVEDAFKKMEQQTYDAIVSDYEMPQKNGLDFLKELREQNNQIPFILFTGKGREDVAIKALNLGADRYINKQGNPETVYGELSDALVKTIEHKQSKKMLVESESKYRKLVENSLQGIAIIQGPPPKFVFVNAAMKELFGYTPEEMTALSSEQIIKNVHPDDREAFFTRFKKRIEGKDAESTYVFRGYRKDGTLRWVEVCANLIEFNGKPAVQGVFLDITESKKAEENLRESEQKYRELANCLPDIVFETDLNGQLEFANERAVQISGYCIKEIEKGLNIFQFIVPEEKEIATKNIQKLLSGSSYAPTEYTFLRKDGTTFPALITAAPRISKKTITGFRGIVLDISERKKLELAQKEKYEVLERVGESIGAGLAIIGKDYSIFWANSLLKNAITDRNKKCYQNFNKSNTICSDCGVKKVFEQNVSLDVHEFKTVNSKGETVWVELRVTPLKDKDGKVTAALELAVPITERKAAEHKLRENQHLTEKILYCTPNLIYIYDLLENCNIYSNKEVLDFLGYSPEQIKSMGSKLFANILHPDDTEVVAKHHARFANAPDNATYDVEYRMRHSSGEWRWLRSRDTLFGRTKQGLSKQILGTCQDITERKKTKELLVESEEKYRTLVETADDAILLTDLDGKHIFRNKAYYTSLGYMVGEDITLNGFANVHPDDLTIIKNRQNELLKKGSNTSEYRVRHKNGSWIYRFAKSKVIYNKAHEPTAILAVIRDVTERKRAEEEIKKQAALIDLSPDAVIVKKMDDTITFWNMGAEKLYGYTKQEAVGQKICFLLKGKRSKLFDDVITQLKQGKTWTGEITNYTKNNSEVIVQSYWSATLNAQGDIVEILESNVDITERKHAEEALKESEKRSRAIVANSPIGIATSGANKHFLSANSAFCRILGYTEEELRKLTFKDITYSEDLNASILKMRELGKGTIASFTLEKRYVKKDGAVIEGKIMINAVRGQNGEPNLFVAELEDITECKKAEERRKVLERKVNEYSKHLKSMVELRTAQLKDANERLVKTERLAAIGELAGMVGHDLRNPLTGIKNAAYYLKKKGTTISETQAKEMLEIIDKSINHSNKIINDLLDYAREMHLELTKYPARTLVEDAIRMIQVPDRIQIVNDVNEEVLIWVDADKMMRVFINLIKNAIDAMPEKGTLKVTSCKTREQIKIAFVDTGTGIPKEVLPKIFSPLFTTKAQGMGFGLAICKRIIDAHEGNITLETSENKGTTFTITLPVKPKMALLENQNAN